MFELNLSAGSGAVLGIAASLFTCVAAPGDVAAGDRYALLVGVRQYDPKQLCDLEFAEADATVLASALRNVGYAPERIVLMTQAEGGRERSLLPTGPNISSQLKLLLDKIKAQDTLLIMFSGHGVQINKVDYFCPYDTDLSDTESLLSLTQIYTDLTDRKKCPAGLTVMLVDACRNDPQSAFKKAVEVRPLNQAQAFARPELKKGTTALFSCQGQQVSYEHPDLKHGVFANYVIAAFRGQGDANADNKLSVAELHEFSAAHTKQFVNVEFRKVQVPERVGETQDISTIAEFPKARVEAVRPMNIRESGDGPLGRSKVNSLAMKFVLLPAGQFTMGSPQNEIGRGENEESQVMKIKHPFYIQNTEVTLEQWVTLMKDEPGRRRAVPPREAAMNSAVSFVTWQQADEFCRRLSKLEGLKYRLPTEAEWEYACRAGSVQSYHFGNNQQLLGQYAWFNDNTVKVGRPFPHPVAAKQPNKWDLFDTHGNVAEWCLHPERRLGIPAGAERRNATARPPNRPSLPSRGVLRGGGFHGDAASCRSAARRLLPQTIPVFDGGFRVVRPVAD